MAWSGDWPLQDVYIHGEPATPRIMKANWRTLTAPGANPARPAAGAHPSSVTSSATR